MQGTSLLLFYALQLKSKGGSAIFVPDPLGRLQVAIMSQRLLHGWQEQAVFVFVPSAPSCEAMQLVTCIHVVARPGM